MGCSASMETDVTAYGDPPSPRSRSTYKDDVKRAEMDTIQTENGGKKEGQNGEQAKEEEKEETEKKKEKVTPEQAEEMIQTISEQMRENLLNMKNTENWKDEEGYYILAVRNNVKIMSSGYFAMKGKCEFTRLRMFRREIGNIIQECGGMEACCVIILDIYPGGWAKEDKMTDLKRWTVLVNSLLTLINYSDDNENFAVAVCDYPGFMELLHKILVDLAVNYLDETKDLPVNRQKVLKWALSIVHNCSKFETNIPRLRSLDFTSALIPYLQSPDKKYILGALAALSGIINEAESDVIHTNMAGLKYVLMVLRKGLDDPLHRHLGWSVEECGQTVRQLARNDANKKLLVECGALQLLVKMAKTGDVAEKREAVGAIWALSFDEDNQKKMVEDEELDLVGTLLEVKKIDDLKVKQGCNGTLWTLREKLKSSEKYKDIGQRIVASRPGAELKKQVASDEEEKVVPQLGHVMISYQWSNQNMMIRVRDVLRSCGFQVWMDVDNMGGSTVQAMAEAVENAHVFLMCMSTKYKNSPNCRAEAEYAFQLRKKIIPLLLERGYKADGWLGFILGAKLFYEFTDKYPFQEKADALKKELKVVYGQKTEEVIVPVTVKPVSSAPDQTDAPVHHPVTMATAPVSHLVSRTTLQTIRNWKKDDVTKWINKNHLSVQSFGHLTGGEIAMMASMKHEAPEFFYKCLQEMLKVKTLLEMSQIVWALEDLLY